MNNEIWLPVVGYDGIYEVSNFGRVKSIRFGKTKVMKQSNSHGYKTVELCVDRHRDCQRVHRLVAFAFIPNNAPDTKIFINHKDGNRSNNHVDNLEWCTASENIEHAYRVLQVAPRPTYQSQPNQIKIIEENSGVEYFSIREASRQLNIKRDTIKRSINLGVYVCGGKYRFVKVNNNE